MNLSTTTEEIMLVSADPYFLAQEDVWFEKNMAKIRQVARNQIWWKENTLFLTKNQEVSLFALMRRLTEMGYERVQTLGNQGELAQRGGILDIFPINSAQAFRLEFSGKQIAEIYPLDIKILKKERGIKKSLSQRMSLSSLTSAKPGQHLVHLDHGIGIFKGLAVQPGGQIATAPPGPQSPEKYFVLEYAKSDRLYVPLELEEKLSCYIGFETPIVHRLGGTLWSRTKRQAKEEAWQLAQQLLELYGKRAAAGGFKFPPDDALQRELEDSFEFIETADQLAALADTKKDMQQEKPMDRLICGDVGFGKTEVALRAAFKAVLAGKQVALLTPTTILAHQHYQTFFKRLKKFPVNIALLSRLEPKKQQTQTAQRIKEGKIDIVIGTHRLLQKDVQFKNLGLLIVDEEQRFGVRQKEVFKGIRQQGGWSSGERSELYGVDILSLSATPIPRTMHLALSGLRDISTISTPPAGRLTIKTFIQPFSAKIIKQAILQELNRGGQVYYLHNRIETIGLVKKQIEKLPVEVRLPQRPRIAIAHGRLNETQLIKVMDDFGADKIDILLATTIIENGLDLPNVNTLIVDNATKLGLAQSYQIRGRIGRSDRQAYAYFLYNAKNLTDIARQRLDALKEAEALGSGHQLALRDLEIRGAGNVLGREQSGPINAVGLNLYMQMLNEAMEEMKNTPH